ncbi:hypothetical protein HMPREF0673_02321 [Leyella stercorea DSM 18206]|uniref:Uncharacterized protein n=1 Tax=Leyella stercorea DSM 18206 TaxID=1002367 RepID=G6B0A3_9BACT|nr:hypothetical protein HMPREF0673_02321 [Leyella stercorea DSM 18206]
MQLRKQINPFFLFLYNSFAFSCRLSIKFINLCVIPLMITETTRNRTNYR